MIFQNLVEIPLLKILDNLYRATLGDHTILVDDMSLVTTETKAGKDVYSVKLPCNCKTVCVDKEGKRYKLDASDEHMLVVAKQNQIISNADGTIGSINIDEEATESEILRYSFINPNSHNTNITNVLCGVLISCRFATAPETIRHMIYSTLTSKYGAIVSSDDEIGTGAVLDRASVVNNVNVLNMNALMSYGGIIEIPNASSILSIKRKVWDKCKIFELDLSTVGDEVHESTELIVKDTNGIGFFTSLWDAINNIEVVAGPSIYYIMTFDKKTYVVYKDGKWIPVISTQPDIHGDKDYTWHILVGSEWVSTESFAFDLEYVAQAMENTDLRVPLTSLNDLSSTDINTLGGFVMREASYLDLIFYHDKTISQGMPTVKLNVSETGYKEITTGSFGDYDVIRKHDKGRQLHTIISRCKDTESITIDYL